MQVIVHKSETVCIIEKLINDGKTIIIYDFEDSEILHLIYERIIARKLSNVEIWQCTEETIEQSHSRYVMRRDINKVLEMYHMYEFSDKVIVISESMQYAGLFNYVKTGVMTKNEIVDAVLYKVYVPRGVSDGKETL